MCTRERVIPLAMMTIKKSIHEFPLLSYMGMGARLMALRTAETPLLTQRTKIKGQLNGAEQGEAQSTRDHRAITTREIFY